MTPSRRTEVTLRKLVDQNGAVLDVDGNPMLRPEVDTQVIALASLRQMPIPGQESEEGPDGARKAKNARKRERRARK